MRLGLSIKLDVTKIDKARLYQGEKGIYLDVTTFVNTNEPDEYGNNGFVSQDVSQEERQQGVKGNILGNVKVFWKAGEDDNQMQAGNNNNHEIEDNTEDDIPF